MKVNKDLFFTFAIVMIYLNMLKRHGPPVLIKSQINFKFRSKYFRTQSFCRKITLKVLLHEKINLRIILLSINEKSQENLSI